MSKDHILGQFDARHSDLNKLKDKALALIKDVLTEHEGDIFAYEARVKKRESLEEKLERKNGKYQDLDDLTDIVGIRIITYYTDHAEKIAEVLKGKFDFDAENSEDKLTKLEHNEFGYRSIHLVLSLGEERANLHEYASIAAIRFEVQIRSNLQHAWANTEHGMGYKDSGAVPKELRRKLYSLAGIFEIADNEFIEIRKRNERLEHNITKAINNNNTAILENISIDPNSLRGFFKSELWRGIEDRTAQRLNATLTEDYWEHGLERFATALEQVRIRNLDELVKTIDFHKFRMPHLIAQDLSPSSYGKELSRGFACLYLVYYLLAGDGGSGRNLAMQNFVRNWNFSSQDEPATGFIERLGRIYYQIPPDS